MKNKQPTFFKNARKVSSKLKLKKKYRELNSTNQKMKKMRLY